MLSMQGVPGIYYHSLFGSKNWEEGVESSGINRRINREKLMGCQLKKELAEKGALRNLVFDGYMKLLKVRKEQQAFSPFAGQTILNYGSEIFALERENGQRIRVLINVTDHAVELPKERRFFGKALLRDGKEVQVRKLKPFEVLWVELY